MNSPAELIAHPDSVILGLDASGSEDAIRQMHARLVAQSDAVRDPERLLNAVLERTRMSTVCIAPTTALPHARTDAVDRLVLAVARTRAGVAFDAAHPAVRLIFFIGTPNDALTDYLHLVADLSHFLRNPAAPSALLAATDEAQFRAALAGGVQL